jgi:hypothetical protein
MNQNNFLILGFKNAKQFKPKKYKDKFFDLNGTHDRDDSYFFEEPITKFQISNLLHVMFGERPSPSLRETLIPRIEYYFQKAEKSYIRLDSLKIKNKKGEENFIYETMQTRKSIENSLNPNVIVYWEKVKQLMENDFNCFINLLQKEYGFNPLDKSLNEWIPILKENLVVKNYLLNVKGKKPVYDYIYSENKKVRARINQNSRTKRTVLFGKESVTKHHGEIIVPIENEDLEKLSKSTATILDGGLVWIKGVFNENQIDWEGFIKMTEINSEKTKLKKIL